MCVESESYNGCHNQNRRLCSRPHSHESVIFSYFWHSYFWTYGQFVEYMNMHAAGCWRKQCGSAHYTFKIGDGSRQVVHAMNWLHPWRHNCWGVTAGRPRHNPSNVGGVTAGQVEQNSSIINVTTDEQEEAANDNSRSLKVADIVIQL